MVARQNRGIYDGRVAERGHVGGLSRERERPGSHLSCKETGIAAKPGRDGPTPSGAGSGSVWMEGGFRAPVKAGST